MNSTSEHNGARPQWCKFPQELKIFWEKDLHISKILANWSCGCIMSVLLLFFCTLIILQINDLCNHKPKFSFYFLIIPTRTLIVYAAHLLPVLFIVCYVDSRVDGIKHDAGSVDFWFSVERTFTRWCSFCGKRNAGCVAEHSRIFASCLAWVTFCMRILSSDFDSEIWTTLVSWRSLAGMVHSRLGVVCAFVCRVLCASSA